MKAVAALKLAVGRGSVTSAQECGEGEASTKRGRPCTKSTADREQSWNMDRNRSTKLEGARRAWETYASVGQLPRSGAVDDPKVRKKSSMPCCRRGAGLRTRPAE